MDDFIVCSQCGQERPRYLKRTCCHECHLADRRARNAAAKANPPEIVACNVCGEDKPRHRPETRKCRECYLAQAREYGRRRYAEDTEGEKARRKARRERNHERHLETQRRWRAANRGKTQTIAKRHYWANREKQSARNREYRYRDIEATRKRVRDYYHANRSKERARNRKYSQANPEVISACMARRRARTINLKPIPKGWKAKQQRSQGGKCAGCGTRFSKSRKPTIDHIVAITAGGSNVPVNLQLLCGPCNTSKSNLPESAWHRRKFGRLL